MKMDSPRRARIHLPEIRSAVKNQIYLVGMIAAVVAMAGCATTPATATEQVIVSFAPLNVATGNQQIADNFTPLHLAAREGADEMIKILLQQGENINATSTQSGTTPLILAATNGHEQAITVLLDAGAAVNTADKLDGTALMYASSKGYLGIVRKLLQHNAAVNRHSPKDSLDSTALGLAAGNGQDAVLSLLIEAGADLGWRTQRDGFSALMVAAELGHARSVALLLSAGADPEVKDWKGNTACDLAAANSHDAVTKVLDDFYLAHGHAQRCRAHAKKTSSSTFQPSA